MHFCKRVQPISRSQTPNPNIPIIVAIHKNSFLEVNDIIHECLVWRIGFQLELILRSIVGNDINTAVIASCCNVVCAMDRECVNSKWFIFGRNDTVNSIKREGNGGNSLIIWCRKYNLVLAQWLDFEKIARTQNFSRNELIIVTIDVFLHIGSKELTL